MSRFRPSACHVEFVGAAGAGKSTICSAIRERVTSPAGCDISLISRGEMIVYGIPCLPLVARWLRAINGYPLSYGQRAVLAKRLASTFSRQWRGKGLIDRGGWSAIDEGVLQKMRYFRRAVGREVTLDELAGRYSLADLFLLIPDVVVMVGADDGVRRGRISRRDGIDLPAGSASSCDEELQRDATLRDIESLRSVSPEIELIEVCNNTVDDRLGALDAIESAIHRRIARSRGR